jgi:hypothetical protein
MASVPPDKPDTIEPAAPPEKTPAPSEPFVPGPPEFEPVDPDFDDPSISPQELPPE